MTDFVLDFPADRPIRILQLTDMQTIDLSATRNPTRDRQIKGAYFKDGEPEMESRVYREVRALVGRVKPDLIVLTGDNVYGEFDDTGRLQRELVELMDSFGIPWAPVFGNHDNESDMGVNWQIERFMTAKHCRFSRGSVTGNSNYSIMLTRGGTPAWVLMMLDSNGCHPVGNPWAPEEGIRTGNRDIACITQAEGIHPDQAAWYAEVLEKAALPSLAFFHIPIHAFATACREKYGYEKGVPMEANAPGDWGRVIEHFSDRLDPDDRFFETARRLGTVGIFVGHQHNNSACIDHRGVKLVWGVKTGRCTYYPPDRTGGTLITLPPAGGMTVEAVYMPAGGGETR
ncbi:MAG: metallophosphoesterase [Clostridia bacterium]|nr:metallophosphoesterase [Clostridia bacterium]